MDKDNEFKLEISQDKLIDILMHTATREDIAKLDAKIDDKVAKLDDKIDKLEAKVDDKINKLENKIDKLEDKVDKLNTKVDENTNSLRNEFKNDIRWVIGTIITVGLGLAGFMFTLLHK